MFAFQWKTKRTPAVSWDSYDFLQCSSSDRQCAFFSRLFLTKEEGFHYWTSITVQAEVKSRLNVGARLGVLAGRDTSSCPGPSLPTLPTPQVYTVSTVATSHTQLFTFKWIKNSVSSLYQSHCKHPVDQARLVATIWTSQMSWCPSLQEIQLDGIALVADVHI